MVASPPRTLVAVIMGDLVDSERASSVDAVYRAFNTAIDDANGNFATELRSPLTITLGDEFQGLTRTLKAAVAIVQKLRLDLLAHGIDCRFVIGLAALETPVNPARAWNMMGEGLAAAREILNYKEDITLYRFSLLGEGVLGNVLDSLGAAITAIERDWTPRQREIVFEAMAARTPVETARRRNITAHSVYKVRLAAELDRYRRHWQAIAQALAFLDVTHRLR